MAHQIKKQLDFLLLGKTGHGKSATGNSILGWKAFESASSSTSVTFGVQQAWAERGDCLLKVVDAPGLGDSRLNDEEKTEKAVSDMTKALYEFSEGFHALIIVIKFGQRFTAEEQDTIDLLKGMLGPNVFQRYGVCVMTCGDLFQDAMEEEGNKGMTSLQWCERQKDCNFSKLFQDCGSRLLLFDNRTKDKEAKKNQVEELLRMVKKLPNNGVRYTCAQFETMRRERDKLIMKAKLPQMKEELKKKCSLLEQDLKNIYFDKEGDAKKLAGLKLKANDLMEQIDKDDQGTGVLMPLRRIVTSLKLTIEVAEGTRRDKREDELKKQIQELTRQFLDVKQSLKKDAMETGFLDTLEGVVKGLWGPPKYLLNKIGKGLKSVFSFD